MSERILVVEDEVSLQETLTYNLQHHGFQVDAAPDGREAIRLAQQQKPDLVLLDIMLPGIDGFEVCRILRQDLNAPIVFLTARDDEIDRIIGLEIGGDDYIAKPFSMRELIARVKARLRMTQLLRQQTSALEKAPAVGALPAAERSVKISGNLTIDQTRREILKDGKPILHKPKEYDLLLFFVGHSSRMISREQILREVWGYDFIGDSRTIDVHVHWLREKIEVDPSNPTRIVTVRGGGYRFEG